MRERFKILFVDDEPNLLLTSTKILRKSGYQVSEATSGEEALRLLSDDSDIKLALVDLRMPGLNGLDVLRKIKEKDIEVAVIIITAFGSIDSAIQTMKIGAIDYLVKPINPSHLLVIVDKAYQRWCLIDENAYFMKELSKKYNFDNIIGKSSAMISVFEKVHAVAETDTPVLVTGESGTGKELIAHHIHYAGGRHAKPLVAVSCASLSPGIVDSELFGHEKGAFTGAIRTKIGRFELANEGTVFLDEVGDIPLTFQPKLLRVLQSMKFERVGGSTLISSNFRLISATNQNIKEKIEQEKFREDLYFRFAVVEIEIPPLRNRIEDLPVLVDHFLTVFSSKMNKRIYAIEDEAMATFKEYHWPGNIRELKNTIERAFVFCNEEIISLKYIQLHETPGSLLRQVSQLPTRNLQEIEKAVTQVALLESKGNNTKTADILGVTRPTVINKIKKYSLATKPHKQGI